MVLTVLEARVSEDRVADLEQEYRKATSEKLDAGIVETMLVREARDPSLFRILTLWSSRAALEEMRNSGQTPRGVLIFQAAGAQPQLSISHVVLHARS